MKYNIIGYLIGEGFSNVLKNKKSTIATIIIMSATMILFGIFFAISKNVDYVMTEVKAAQGIQVFIENEATEEQVQKIGETLKNMDYINTTDYISKEDALTQMKEKLQERAYILDGYNNVNPFPESYIITLTDLTKSSEVQNNIMQLENVKKIRSSDKTISTLIQLANGIKIVTAILLVILIAISIFIISNTIKLTMYARRKEISIMKYIGATNGFVRSPFIVEGIILGVFSGAISILTIGLSYNFVTEKLIQSSIAININLALISFSEILSSIIIVYAILGIGIGIIGSSISIKKYLKV